MTTQRIRVLVVDDQDVIREAVIGLLEDDGTTAIVGEAANGAEAVERVVELDPDVVLMDMRMPVMDGVEATRLIAEQRPHVSVLVHSAYDDESLVLEAFQAGARGYVLKGSTASDVLTAVQAVASGNAHVSDEVARPVITKLVHALDRERQTRQAAEEAAALIARVTAQQQEFAIQAAHELRTPLTVLTGALETLVEIDELAAGERRSLAASALQAARRFARLTEDLEVIATGDQLQLELSATPLHVAIADVVRNLGADAQVDAAVGDIHVVADPVRLRQVLDHIVRNAIALSPKRSSVKVCAATSADGAVRIDVADRGPGFNDEVLEALFEPFSHKLGSASGLGVGLAVVRDLVGRMGGAVAADNNDDEGATVTIMLRGAA